MSELRRSGRNRNKSQRLSEIEHVREVDDQNRSVQNIETDNNTALTEREQNGETGHVDVDDVDDIDEDLEESSSSEEEDNPEDDDYVDPSVSRKRKRNRAPTNKQSKRSGSVQKPKTIGKNTKRTNKRSKPSNAALPLSEVEQQNYIENMKDAKHSELFEILSEAEDISIEEFLRGWLEGYNENRDHLLEEFINFLLDCCGTLVQVEAHDVHNNESANETISEIQLLFQQQKVHEFHLMISKNSKKKSNYKPLYNNFVEFMSLFLDVANDLQLLYIESQEDNSEIEMGPLIVDLLTWLSSMSVAKIRCFRYVSTLTLYLFQDFLSKHIVDLEKNYLSKFSKQLTLEEKKKRPNKSTIQKLESNIAETQGNKTVTENIIDNIVKLCFVHRFKDVDEHIRSISMSHLASWVKNYPEYFMKVTFLKYFGWLLSDSSSMVRAQVLKTLPDIISSSHLSKVDNSATRQFFERFKQRILDIALKDIDLEVRLKSVNVLAEVATLGYLEDSEVLAISSLIFDDNEIKVSSHSKNSRFLAAVAKFLANVTYETSNEFMKTNNEIEDISSPLESSVIVNIGIMMRFLNNSFLYFLQEHNKVDNTKKLHILFQAAEFLSPYFNKQLDGICKLLTDDNGFQEMLRTLDNIEKENSERTDDDDDDDFSLNSTPLLPTNDDNIILYLTVLNGICHGATSLTNQQKVQVSETVLPHFIDLMKNLSIQSINILAPILEIFNLFSFEDWIEYESENLLLEAVKILEKTFNETNMNSLDIADTRYKMFAYTLRHLKEFDRDDIDQLWINTVQHLKIQLRKFLFDNQDLDSLEDINEFVNTIYSVYLNKLVILGREYTIEFDEELSVLLFRSLFSLLSRDYSQLNTEMIGEVNFKLPVLLVTWQLQKWTDIIKKTMERSSSCDTSHSNIPAQSLKYVRAILDQLAALITSIKCDNMEKIHGIFKLRLSLANSICDIVVAIKCFELQLPDSEENLKTSITDEFPVYVTESVSEALKDVYLYLEGLAAAEMGIQLERIEDEDATLNELTKSSFINDSEKELLLYTIKLKGLIRLDVLGNDVNSRISLNKESFDPLYQKIVDDSLFEENNTKQKPNHPRVNEAVLSSEPMHIPQNSIGNMSESIIQGTQESNGGSASTPSSSLPGIGSPSSATSQNHQENVEELEAIAEHSIEDSENPQSTIATLNSEETVETNSADPLNESSEI